MKPTPRSSAAPLALPIDSYLYEIGELLRKNPALILHAEPGAGKTTRVPSYLLQSGFGRIAVLEPRRLAAKLAAERVADESNQPIGQDIGYQFRFEKQGDERTRLWFLTEGLLMRKLVADPTLSEFQVVVLDEFHERHIHGDLALSSLRELQKTKRPDLKILVMSATLDIEPLKNFLKDAGVVSVPGKVHPVQTVYWPSSFNGYDSLEKAVTQAVEKVWDAEKSGAQSGLATGNFESGDILVFLPGKSEIYRCESMISQMLGKELNRGIEVHSLHAELSKEKQHAAVTLSDKRKVILATNVAESSVTIPGVSVVIDTGWVRQSTVSPFSGIGRLELKNISKASGTQRAGRAGREKPGLCVRLFSKADWDARPHFDLPEIKRTDLSQPVLELKAQGFFDLNQFSWFEKPPQARLDQAIELLFQLGILAANQPESRLTLFGKKVAQIPIHPRLARMCWKAQSFGVSASGRKLAAGLQEGLIEGDDFQSCFDQIKAQATPQLSRIETALKQAFPGEDFNQTDLIQKNERLAQAVLSGFPDRVGKRRGQTLEYTLSGGGSIPLPESASAVSAVVASEFVVIADAKEMKSKTAGKAKTSAKVWFDVDPSWFIDLEPTLLVEKDEFRFIEESSRIELASELRLGEVLVSSEKKTPENWEQASTFFAKKLMDPKNRGSLSKVIDELQFQNWKSRWKFAKPYFGEKAAALDWELDETFEAALSKWLYGHTKLSDAAKVDFFEFMMGSMPKHQADLFNQVAPYSVQLPRGRKCVVHYEPNQTPWIESRIQDFFGLSDGPKIGKGQVALVIKLLAPSQRPVQVTSDLAGFWKRSYPEIRRELSRDYPKHKWPEDPVQG